MAFLNLEQAAAHLQMRPLTLRSLAAKGDMPAAKLGRRWVFNSEALDDYVSGMIQAQTNARRKQPPGRPRVL
jgi:excisionase family DNA binding protein